MSVLYLDDEVLIALDGCAVLEANGLDQVMIAHTERAANSILDGNTVDLAVLDINIGEGYTSFDIARRVKKTGGTVVFTTGYSDRDMPCDLSEDVVLLKPFTPEELTRTIEGVLKP